MSEGLGRQGPELSVVVVVHDMAREAPRTLHSLSAAYQQNIAAEDYEVIVVDNGSQPAFDAKGLDGLAGNFRLIRLDPAPPSPAKAINTGLAAARGGVIGVMIDGARIVTPGLLHFARKGAGLYPRSVVATLGWYLGFDVQRWAIEAGYDRAREDALLASIDWPKDGYRLFEIAALDNSSIDGWFQALGESNGLFLRRETWTALSGVDERFDLAGGGFLNLDTLRRAIELPESELVILLGEGTFHQVHGGISTNVPLDDLQPVFDRWLEQYQAIRGRPWEAPNPAKRTYLGVLPKPALAHFARAAVEPVRAGADGGALDAAFDRTLWALPAPPPRDKIVAALTELAQAEFRARRYAAAAAVARLARARAPDEPAPQRLLAQASAWLPRNRPGKARLAGFHLALAKAHRLLGDSGKAAAEYRAALAADVDLAEAYVGLAELRMPGEGYLSVLARFHAALRPQTYLEIGVARGTSLACAQPPTRIIGVDPAPAINTPLKAETHIYCETSDAFFDRQGLAPLLNGRPLGMAFIDGLHRFGQSLRDFMHVEAFCGPQSVVLLHDTIPFDERTQRPERELTFYTGDVWKTVVCLKHYRPDLDVFTIATPWSGLTVVTGLDAASRVLSDSYDEAMKRFGAMPFAEIEHRRGAALNIFPNDWNAVAARLAARGIGPDAGRPAAAMAG